MIIAYAILILAVIGLALILFNVPVSQKAINILLLVALVLLAATQIWNIGL